MKDSARLTNVDKLLFALIFFGLLLRLLFAPPIANRGEAREGLVVQGILHGHQWILPFRNGELPSKPPLYHWIAASGALVIGASDFAMRLPSAIGAGVMIWVTFLLGRAMGGRRTGWLAVGAILGIYDFWHAAGQARVDMVFSACVTAAIAGFYFWYRERTDRARAICYLATVGAVLAKGPLGIALVGLVVLAFLVVDKQPRLLWSFWSWPLVGAALVVIGGWYGWAYAIGGQKFLALQIAIENVERLVGGEAFPRRPVYLDTAIWLATRTLPWNLVLIWSLVRWRRGTPENSDGRLLQGWWLAMFCLFSAAAFARPVYFLPLLPAIALLAARALNTAMSEPARAMKAGAAKAFTHGLEMRWRRPSTWIAIGVPLCDLILMFVSYGTWRDDSEIKARLAFEEKVRAEVAVEAPLFAASWLDDENLMVLAYRLEREIDRKPMACAKRNDYFLTLTYTLVAGQARVLALMDRSKIGLLRMVNESPAVEGKACQNQTVQALDEGDH